MPTPVLRRGLWALGLAVLTIAIVVLVIPYAASTKIVRDRIALEMSAWSGFQVSIGAAPQIEIWPSFGATLTDVTLSPWGEAGSENPVITSQRVEIELSALAALRGNVVFSEARFIQPTLYLQQSPSGFYLPTLPGGGRLSRAVEVARALVDENRDKPDLSQLPHEEFGGIEFVDGRIVASSENGEDAITNVNGKIDWPALNRPGSLSGHGVWHSESVAVDLGAANPLLLFAGANTPLFIALKSSPVNFSFGGSASLTENGYFEGKAVFTTPSLPDLLEWSGTGMALGSEIGSIDLETQVAGSDQRVKFGDTNLTVNGSTGTGAIDLALAGNRPVISGTLAFATLDLHTLMSAFISSDTAEDAENALSGFAKRINLDLRLSADKASAGSVTLTEVAATAQVNEGFSAFDISDATAFGGTVQAGLHIDRKAGKLQSEIRLQATDIDGNILGAAAGMKRLVPGGKGTISVVLKGEGRGDNFLENATGSISANFGPGTLSGFDLDGFLNRTRRSGFFGLDEVASGTLPTNSIDLEASVANGVATIGKAEIMAPNDSIILSGIASYAGRGLALSGLISPTLQAPEQAATVASVTFFVGGTWDSPFVSPVMTTPPE